MWHKCNNIFPSIYTGLKNEMLKTSTHFYLIIDLLNTKCNSILNATEWEITISTFHFRGDLIDHECVSCWALKWNTTGA